MTEFKIKNELRPLTSFRFLAALYVFLFHLQIRTPVFGDGIVGNAMSEGAVGMTMFFTLSGFILMHAYYGSEIDLRKFFWNRFSRIYPIYFVAAILALPWLAKGVIHEASLTSATYAFLACIVLIILGLTLLQAWLPQTFSFWNNSASWSISNEAFFYSLFPHLRAILNQWRIANLTLAFVALSLLSSMIPLSSIVFSNSPKIFSLTYALPFFRLPEFICGMIAYILAREIRWTSILRLTLFLVMLAGILHVVVLSNKLPVFTLHNWIFVPAVSSSLVLLYLQSSEANGLLSHSIFVWLGRISYCFYSFQFHVLEGLKPIVPTNLYGGDVVFFRLLCRSALSGCAHPSLHRRADETLAPRPLQVI